MNILGSPFNELFNSGMTLQTAKEATFYWAFPKHDTQLLGIVQNQLIVRLGSERGIQVAY
jgi:hypothetical protein